MAFAAVILVPYAYARASIRSLAACCRRSKALVLTYDDGPGTTLTPDLLQLLQHHNVKATFFALGCKADRNPELLDQVLEQGHEIGCHGDRHCHAWKVWPRVADCDMAQGYARLARWLPASGMYRPPHGKITLFTWVSVLQRGVRLAWWTHDSGDTRAGSLPAVESVVEWVIQAGGGVVLMHDFERIGGGRHNPRHEYVMNMTARLIERGGQAGLKIMTLGELLGPGRVLTSPLIR